ncbi:MAG: P-loop NTPase [Acidobacteriota bacterium]|jgi:ATP-binding protein involved in chromosome partitioning|nr:P-loop NTPase [Acidobacteriota bacterium]
MNLNLDPRPYAVAARLASVRRTIAVSGFKGGVGKSSVASLLALASTDCGRKTGLLDLDFSGASCHLILGVSPGPGAAFPDEIEGLRPPEAHGVRFMSLAFFTQDRAVHLRGKEVADVVMELLAVTNWGELDVLYLDMPPGISDAALEVMRLMPDIEVVGVLTPSVLSRSLAFRALRFSEQSGVKTAGVIENFADDAAEGVDTAEGFKVLARLPYDEGFEAALGDVARLRQTKPYRVLGKAAI